MIPAGVRGDTPAPSSLPPACVDEGRLDPKLRLTTNAAPPAIPMYLALGFPISFAIALGILLVGVRGALTPEAIGFIVLGGLGVVIIRYLNRRS
jgi:hypothetical protein